MSSSSSNAVAQDQSVEVEPPSNVDKIRDEINDLQRKLTLALRKSSTAGDEINKNAGFVDVDFVRTKSSGGGCCTNGKGPKTILHSFHADFPEGCVTALMGPSGAGKTTLLDFLTGTLGDSVHASGRVALPDNDAYVPQDDRLHAFYTCQQYMEHYARLTGMLPLCGGGKDDVQTLIATILSEVGLERQKDTVVGGLFKRGLSGGQKRRLSVALEALSSPLNLFLDEPTSGLDSESALSLMEYLKEFARGTDPETGRRRRVVVTIHQPSSHIWELIDNVVLLAQGHIQYQGPRQKMNEFFSAYGHPVPVNYNPADHFIEVLFKNPNIGNNDAGDYAPLCESWSNCFEEWCSGMVEVCAARRSSDRPTILRTDDPTDNNKLKAHTMKSVRTAIELTRRAFVNLFRNPAVLGLRVGIYGSMSIMIGILFFGLANSTDGHSIIVSRTAMLYFIIAYCSSMSVAVIPFAIVDRGIVEKEVRNHMFHPVWYHAASALASIPACLFLSFLVSVIILSMTGLERPTGFGLILFLTFLCADSTSMFVAHVSSEIISALCISSGIFGLFTMVMGFMVTPSNMQVWIRWMYYIPFMTYSFRSLMYNSFEDLVFDTSMVPEDSGLTKDQLDLIDIVTNDQQTMDSIEKSSGIAVGMAILESFEMENVNVAQDMIVLAVWTLVMHLVSMIYLVWKQYKGRRIFVYDDE